MPPPPRAIHAFLSGIVDYAGLFPPAKLDMPTSARNYADYLRSPHSWMLGRFICPVSRLEEFRKATIDLLPRTPPPAPHEPHAGLIPDTHEHHAGEPWPISAIIDGDLDENLDAIFAFNHEHTKPERGLAVIDAAEIKTPGETTAAAAVFIDEALDLIPEEIFPFFEISTAPNADFRGLIAALSGADAGAKIRTGGITPDAFPDARTVAEFLAACAAGDVPFKATAGLHHPVRAEHPLTYEPNCPRGVMHGFLNVFAAAAMLHTRAIDAAMAADVLAETDPRAFKFSDDELRYRTVAIAADDLALTRETFALSFGSCSFTEPVNDLCALGLL
jgi:hypothetical protein